MHLPIPWFPAASARCEPDRTRGKPDWTCTPIPYFSNVTRIGSFAPLGWRCLCIISRLALSLRLCCMGKAPGVSHQG